MEFEGQGFCFTHLPFGLSSACRVYTIIMGKVYRPLREFGFTLTYLIALFAFRSKPEHEFRLHYLEGTYGIGVLLVYS